MPAFLENRSLAPNPNEPGGWAILIGLIFFAPPALTSFILILIGATRTILTKRSSKTDDDAGLL